MVWEVISLIYVHSLNRNFTTSQQTCWSGMWPPLSTFSKRVWKKWVPIAWRCDLFFQKNEDVICSFKKWRCDLIEGIYQLWNIIIEKIEAHTVFYDFLNRAAFQLCNTSLPRFESSSCLAKIFSSIYEHQRDQPTNYYWMKHSFQEKKKKKLLVKSSTVGYIALLVREFFALIRLFRMTESMKVLVAL